MQEYRCKFCKKLLFKYKKTALDTIESPCGVEYKADRNGIIVEIACSKCKTLNTMKSA